MRPTWDDLELYQIDLHFHAGTERPEHCSLSDFVDFAIATGRRIIGLTDHFGRFLGLSKKKLNHYLGTLEGFHAFGEEIHRVSEAHPDEIILLGPELGLGYLFSEEWRVALSDPNVSFYIADPGGPRGECSFGDILTQGIQRMAKLRKGVDCPGILGHPLRSVINNYVGKAGPGPKMPNHGPLPLLSSCDDPLGHVETLFDLDIDALGKALVKGDVPIEINESSWGRMMGMNHQSFVERYLFFYRELIDRGARVILGSDLHNAEHPGPTPFFVAQMLGIQPRDMAFLRHWLGDP